MLNRVEQSFAPAAVAPHGGLSRAAAGILAAETVDDLADRVRGTLWSLYADTAVQIYLSLGGELVPVGAVDAHESRWLLASVRSRLAASKLSLADARVLSAAEMSGRRSVMSAPILGAGGRLAGVILAEALPTRSDFSRMELVALEAVAALVGTATRELLAERSHRARVEVDRRAARRIQRGFMSARLPDGIGVSARAEYLPALDVGGDFYSAKHLADGSVYATIGDVSGNGVSAALLMSRVAADFEQAIAGGASPAAVLAAVHERLSGLDADRFVTAACLRLDPARRRLEIANAGHLPLVLRRANGEIFTFGGASGAPLGIGPSDWLDDALLVGPGDQVLMMTDGLVEALDPPTGHRGLELLVDLCHDAPRAPAALSASIQRAVDAAAQRHALDDVTWIALQIEA